MRRCPTRCVNTCSAITAKSPDRSIPISSIASPKAQQPTTARPGDLVEPGIPRLRRERGPFTSDDDLLLAAFYSDGQYKALKAAGPIKTDYPLASTPLITLLKEIALRPSVRSFHLIKRPALAA